MDSDLSSTNIPQTGSLAIFLSFLPPFISKNTRISIGLYNCKKYNKAYYKINHTKIPMPLQLDDYDVSILRSLLKDGRKSFREVSRETGITTPTVKARFTRLVNVGFIKSVSPVLNFDIIEKESILKPGHEEQQNSRIEYAKLIEDHNNNNNNKR